MLKKVLSVFVMCALLVSSVLVAMGEKSKESLPESESAQTGIFGFQVLHQLYRQGDNTVLSPTSLQLALSMAADGAKEDTLSEILGAMHVSGTDEILSAVPGEIQSANAAFTSEQAPLYQEYINRLNEAYGAQWFKIDDHVVENANNWVYQHTNGLIDSLLNEKVDDSTGLLLMNAVALQADWKYPFYESNVSEGVFHTAYEDVTVDMMHKTDRFDYAEKDGVQILHLPYANSSLEMVVMLPEEGGVQQLIETLAQQGSAFFMDDMMWQEVDFALPKTDVSDENSFKAALNALGIEKAFGEAADFTSISATPLRISEILQKARIQIDEAGTQAVASTVIMMEMMAAPPAEGETVEMHVDRPFVFAIADRNSGDVCFTGVIEAPQMDV